MATCCAAVQPRGHPRRVRRLLRSPFVRNFLSDYSAAKLDLPPVTATLRKLGEPVIMQRAWPVMCCLLIVASRAMPAQDKPSAIQILGMSLTGNLRGRIENWDWFSAPPAQDSYTYDTGVLRLNLGQSLSKLEWQLEGGFPLLLNLPGNAVAPEPLGPLGYGGDYFLANGQRNIGAAVLRQAFFGMKNDSRRFKFRIGRFEFADGTEAVPPDPDLAGLKQERINQRLIGTFNYALRSFDGAQVTYHKGRSDVTAVAARIVEGSFQLRALSESMPNLRMDHIRDTSPPRRPEVRCASSSCTTRMGAVS